LATGVEFCAAAGMAIAQNVSADKDKRVIVFSFKKLRLRHSALNYSDTGPIHLDRILILRWKKIVLLGNMNFRPHILLRK
jgi:hypothetical protein